MTLLSKRLEVIIPSPTLQIAAKAAELKAKGIDVISLGAGEPDFDTHERVKQAAINAINSGKSKYTPVGGIKELKAAVVHRFKEDHGLTYGIENVIISSGGKQAIYNAFMATLEPEDEVIIPAPYWVSYPEIVKICGSKPVIIETGIENEFKIKPEELESAISSHTKWLIINSPNNPTGAVYSKEELEGIAEVIRKHPNVYVMTDDIYDKMVYDTKFYSLIDVAPDLKDRILIVNGASKSYAMTGWRIGYAIGRADLIEAMSTMQSQSTSNPCSISQYAAVEAFAGNQDFVVKNTENYKKKRDLMLSLFRQVEGLECKTPGGAFYVFPDCSKLFGKKTPQGKIIQNSIDLAAYLLEDALVAIVPGSAFGVEGYFRASYATSEEQISQAGRRIIESVKKLSNA